MDKPSLQGALNWSAKEAVLASQRMAAVFDELDRQEIELMEAVWASATPEAYKAAWANLNQFFADKDAKLDSMAQWLGNSHERVVGSFYESKPIPVGTS